MISAAGAASHRCGRFSGICMTTRPTPTTPWRWAFSRMWDVLTGSQRTTPAFTSLFSFITALKAASPVNANAIDFLVTAQNTTTITDIWGTGETHVPRRWRRGRTAAVHGYGAIGGPAVTLLSVNDAGTYNTLGNHRYLRFDVASTRSITITASSSNPNQPDTDFRVWRAGTFVRVGLWIHPPDPETETFTATRGHLPHRRLRLRQWLQHAGRCGRRLQHHRDGQLRGDRMATNYIRPAISVPRCLACCWRVVTRRQRRRRPPPATPAEPRAAGRSRPCTLQRSAARRCRASRVAAAVAAAAHRTFGRSQAHRG